MGRPACTVLAMALALAAPTFAAAQDDEEESAASSDEEAPADEAASEGESESGEESAAPADGEGAAAVASSNAPRKFYFGLYGRYNVVPSFILRMFLDEAPTVSNLAGGVALNIW